MGQPSRVIYLPPGVAAPAISPTQQVPGGPSAVPFDRGFFEKVLPQAVGAFFQQAKCDQPVVELLTVDGTTHYVKGISGVADSWVALSTSTEDHKQPIQVFLPYQTIFRVEIHPCDPARRPMGFVIDTQSDLHTGAQLAVATPVETTPAATAPKAPRRRSTAKPTA
jgi:hypothetical protein